MTQDHINRIKERLDDIQENGKVGEYKDRVWLIRELNESLRREEILRVEIKTCITHLEYGLKAK